MAKRGQKKHFKRITTPLSIGIGDKKKNEWITKAECGPHNIKNAIPLAVLLRDILKICQTNKEVKKVLSEKMVNINGKIRTNEKFPVGLMDIISIEKSGKNYLMIVKKHSRLVPFEISAEKTNERMGKVIKKYTCKKGQIMIGIHDGTLIRGDNNIKTGDTIVLSTKENKINKILKLQKGAVCLIKGGKHAGTVATIEEIVETEAGRQNEARMKNKNEEFITVLKHICVIDDNTAGAYNE
ncbi:MAG: 30S ribosomal protein S4e [Candidatus Micrarchaeia archaeon]